MAQLTQTQEGESKQELRPLTTSTPTHQPPSKTEKVEMLVEEVQLEQAISELQDLAAQYIEQRGPTRREFSPQAFDLLKRKINEYISDLIKQSHSEAKRNEGDIVSKTHVARASTYLVAGRGKRGVKVAGALSGILFGIAATMFQGFVSGATMSTAATIWMIGLAVVGAVLFVINIMRD